MDKRKQKYILEENNVSMEKFNAQMQVNCFLYTNYIYITFWYNK